MRSLLGRTPAWALTAALAIPYLIAAPPSTDLAAAEYRSHLFSRVGFSLWDDSWYGGHHLLAYSVIAPGLSALVGAQPLAALSMALASWLFALAIADRFPARAAATAAWWFALGAGVSLLSNRVPFDLGLALGLGAVVLAQRGRLAGALGLSVLSSLASPVAGAFLALAMAAWALAGERRAWASALCLVALTPIGLLSIAFPEGGSQPFVASAFYPTLAGVLVVAAAIPMQQRVLRTGALLYALALIGSYVLPTAVGGNADRLGALIAGPIAALALASGRAAGARRTQVLLVLAPLLLYWQAKAPVTDFAAGVTDPAVKASYYGPLLKELRTLGVGYGERPVRMEIVPTANHWEARWMAPYVMIARGWERQLDRYRNGLFYEGPARPLTPARYGAWLEREAVSYVALPDAPLDYSGKPEARLLRSAADIAASGLREVWRSRHWRLFAVLGPTPLAERPALLSAASSESFTLRAPRAGSYLVRLRFTPYWALENMPGCVSRGREDWTLVHTERPGRAHVVIRFSLARVFSAGARCG